MFMVFNKEKILSYLISLSTVALLFVLSFAITKKNDEILKTSANTILSNSVESSVEMNQNTQILDTDSGLNPNAQENYVKTESSNVVNTKDNNENKVD